MRKMIISDNIKLIQEIEEDGRNVTSAHIEALDFAVKALKFIEENFPNSFIDYLVNTEVTPTEYFKAKHGIEFITEKGGAENN